MCGLEHVAAVSAAAQPEAAATSSASPGRRERLCAELSPQLAPDLLEHLPAQRR